MNICDAIANGDALVNKTIAISGWYYGDNHSAALGSGDCPDRLIDPKLLKSTPSTFAQPADSDVEAIRSGLAIGVTPVSQFRGRFTGRLQRRTTPQDVEPPISGMPYRFEIERIDAIIPERATFLQPPPCGKDCDGKT